MSMNKQSGSWDPLDSSVSPYQCAGAGMKIKTCPDCNGDCVLDKDTDNERQCPTCGGLGFVPDDDDEEVIKTITNACKNPL